MTDVRADVERNAASLERLRALVGKLSAADLERPLGGDWTVKTALGHLAFWDGRQRAVIERALASGEPLPDEASDAVNAGLEPLLLHLDAGATRNLVLEAADAVNRTLEGADSTALERLAGGASEWIGQRWRHREEHIEQLERAL